MTEKDESKRGRVRRIVLSPLAEDGMRFRQGTSAEKQKQVLNRLADDLSYMSDRGLLALKEWMGSHGEGASKCFWPMAVSIISTAESFEPRPLEEMPALRRWFASAAGRSALQGNRLLAEYEFWRKFKRPPVQTRDREAVARRASEWASKAERVQDRIQRGFSPMHDDAAWLEWYERTTLQARQLVESDGVEA